MDAKVLVRAFPLLQLYEILKRERHGRVRVRGDATCERAAAEGNVDRYSLRQS